MSTERESDKVFTVRHEDKYDNDCIYDEWNHSLKHTINMLFWESGSNAIADSLVPFSIEYLDPKEFFNVKTIPFDAGTSMKIVGRYLHLYNVELGAYTTLDMHKGFVLVCGDERVSFGNGGM